MKLVNKQVISCCCNAILVLTYPVKCQPFPQNLVVSLVFLQLWHSFDDASETMTLNLSNAQLQTNEHKNVDNNSLTTSNPFTCSITSKVPLSSQVIFMVLNNLIYFSVM